MFVTADREKRILRNVSQRDTKALILETAKSIVLSKGYSAVGLNEILAAAGVPKGSFYHHFKSKEDFGVELMKKHLQESAELFRHFLTNPNVNPYERIASLYDTLLTFHRQAGCHQFCLVAKLGPEVSDLSDAMRKAQRDGIRIWIDIYKQCIREGQAMGVIDSYIDANNAAAMMHDLWQGALVRMQIDQSVRPLENALETIKKMLSPK
ncbi:MAG: TetR/AcrR family transcriptional regulator [Smithellaceae bacterium]|nr:TetR/AcrR family transcriptional regulator [Smithellaceae bacterium]